MINENIIPVENNRPNRIVDLIPWSVRGLLGTQYDEIHKECTKKHEKMRKRFAKYEYENSRDLIRLFQFCVFFCGYDCENRFALLPMDVVDACLHGAIENWYEGHGIMYIQDMLQFNKIQSLINWFRLNYLRYLRFNLPELKHMKLRDRIDMYKEFRSSHQYKPTLYLFIWMSEFKNTKILTGELNQLNLYFDSTQRDLFGFFVNSEIGDSMQIMTDHISHDKRYKNYLDFPVIAINISEHTKGIVIFSLFENIRFKLYSTMKSNIELMHLDLTLSVWAISDIMEAMESLLSPACSWISLYKLVVIPKTIGKFNLPSAYFRLYGDRINGFLFLNPVSVVRSLCNISFLNEMGAVNLRLSDVLASIKRNKPNGKDDSFFRDRGSDGRFGVNFAYDGGDLGSGDIGDDSVLFEQFAKKCLDRKIFHQDMMDSLGHRFKLLRMGAFLTVASGDRIHGDVDMDEEFSNDDEMLEEL